ncbi:hypothetical protein [Actinoplanes sp. NPDC051859]|uniref:hypothetical protein n=1 Tax=Actinoplanes sp. NPDC051859 TaxID=3363909 RepID=UPI0037BBD6DF
MRFRRGGSTMRFGVAALLAALVALGGAGTDPSGRWADPNGTTACGTTSAEYITRPPSSDCDGPGPAQM